MNQTQTINDGRYTIQYPNGEHRTLRFKTMKDTGGFFDGKQKVGYLAGPDNETSYHYVGHIDETGNIRFWRTSGLDDTRQSRFRRAVDIVRERPEETGRAYATASGNCYVCNRTLTHPDSLETGIGPECGRRKNRTAKERKALLQERAAAA